MDGYKLFQISAPISHGSSGGPVLDSAGEVIGLAVLTIDGAQNINFAIPIDYARGMLSANNSQPLASIYEPEAEPEVKTVATQPQAPVATTLTTGPVISEDMRKGSFNYLTSKLYRWTAAEAEKELGPPIRERTGKNNSDVTFTIYAYRDPTNFMREFELAFNGTTKVVTDVYAFPWNISWEEGKKAWGEEYKTTKNPNGTKYYGYAKRRLNILVGTNGMILNIGAY
jgi:hypothetical protein